MRVDARGLEDHAVDETLLAVAEHGPLRLDGVHGLLDDTR